jgi:parallel beta-helix repeat protein
VITFTGYDNLIIEGRTFTDSVKVLNCTRTVIRGCSFLNTPNNVNALTLQGCDQCAVEDNSFLNVWNGVALIGSNHCIVRGNRIKTATGIGFSLGTGGQVGGSPSSHNLLESNIVDTCGSDGIYVDLNSAFNRVAGNILQNVGRYGIIVDQSPDNAIVGNVIDICGSYGILITNNTVNGASHRAQVHGNRLTNIASGALEAILAQGGATTVLTLDGVSIQGNTVSNALNAVHANEVGPNSIILGNVGSGLTGATIHVENSPGAVAVSNVP